jgi:hypothetical protein
MYPDDGHKDKLDEAIDALIVSFAHSGENAYVKELFVAVVKKELQVAWRGHTLEYKVHKFDLPSQHLFEYVVEEALRSLLTRNPRNPYRPSVQDIVERFTTLMDGAILGQRILTHPAEPKKKD